MKLGRYVCESDQLHFDRRLVPVNEDQPILKVGPELLQCRD